MIGASIKNLKEEIIEILLQGPLSSKRLHLALRARGVEVTIQAVYKKLNALLGSGVVLKNNKSYIINNEWIKNILKLIDVQDIELPEEGEKFIYKFNSLQNLDAHWKHIMSAFRKKFSKTSIFSYCPHQIWGYLPLGEKAVEEYTRDHEEAGIYHYFTLGGNTDLDKKYRKKFTGVYYKIELLQINNIDRNVHISALGDFVVSSKIEKSLASEIDSIYESKISEAMKEALLVGLFSGGARCSIVIEYNSKKAERVRRQISKPFYIEKQ